jgi:hypothetical protein
MALVMKMEDIAKRIEQMRASYGWDKSDTPLILAKSVFVEAGGNCLKPHRRILLKNKKYWMK